MKSNRRKTFVILTMLLCMVLALSGCKPSQKKVEESSYYKELQAKYDKLKKQNEKLQKENDSHEQLSDAEKRAENYLAKISRDRLVNLEVGFTDNMEDADMIGVKEIYPAATQLAENADRTNKYTPKTLAEKYDPVYTYILYDEDNAIYEITVYGRDYVVFSDLPKYVYYVPNASALGDAFLHYRVNYPSSNLFHRLADSTFMVDGKGNYYENSVAAATASCIDKMEKKKSSRKKAEGYWTRKKINKQADGTYEAKSVTYTYYHHGNTMTVTLYDVYIRVTNMDGKTSWYRVDKAKVQEVKKILKEDLEKRKTSNQEKEKNQEKNTDKNSHEKEIEEESVISSSN